MTTTGDDGLEMSRGWFADLSDENTIEAIVQGHEVDNHLAPLAAFARRVQSEGDGQAPPASATLAALFVAPAARPLVRKGRRQMVKGQLSSVAAKVAGLGVLAKIGLGTSIAAAGVASAGAAGVLPDRASHAVRGAIEVVSPVEFQEPESDPPTEDRQSNFGDRVSSDATGESDGQHGVDGDQISDEAPGAAHRPADPGQGDPPADPGQPDVTGQDRAGETPAGSHVPPSTPGGPPTSTTPSSTVPPEAEEHAHS